MRCTPMPLLAGLLVASVVRAQIPAEQLTVETMPEPGENWFIAVTDNGGYIYDGESGEMQGLLSLSRQTPAVVAHQGRREF